MKNIHVCLVSDQTVPNILAIEQLKPDELLLVSTLGMEAKGKSGHILDCLACKGLDYRNRYQVLTVVENSLIDCHRKLEAWIQSREESDFVVNLTGGTKIMSIAAYEFFKDYGCQMIYIPIHRNEYIIPFPKRGTQKPVLLSQRLSVAEYLKAYGLNALNVHHLPGMAQEARQRKELAHWIVVQYEKLKNLLIWLGGALRPHRGDREFELKGSFSGATNEEYELMKRMGFSVNGSDLEKRLPKSEIQFLTGGWLEEYCFNEVSSNLGRGIDDVVIGIQIKNPKGTDNEFDVMFTKENALFTVECKSLDQQEDKRTEALYKVAALQKDFGLRVGSFLVSTSPYILKNGQVRPSIAARAEHLNTDVISPYEVLNFGQRLKEKLKLAG
ncbi:MAG: DUF1887 family protein [Desulfosarcina sp.]|nr:DUF1887 family protein [Desulfosarcina sp.]MBC2744864.1 DUF1887 family protein [Desulfosarcina sp.]MBC2767772.1 DUF1887 family protein [Desulfosarcina sp.]